MIGLLFNEENREALLVEFLKLNKRRCKNLTAFFETKRTPDTYRQNNRYFYIFLLNPQQRASAQRAFKVLQDYG